MSEGGKQSFAQFAADQNFLGVEQDNTRRWSSGFKKVAVSPERHRRRGTSTPPDVASERSLKTPRRGEIYEGRKATGRADYATARSESARSAPAFRPVGEQPGGASPRSEGHSGKARRYEARDRKRESNSQDLHVPGSQRSRRRRRRARVERTPTPSSSYSDGLESEDPPLPRSKFSGRGMRMLSILQRWPPGSSKGSFRKLLWKPSLGPLWEPGSRVLG